MANTKSAIKRIRVAERNRLRNKAYKSAVKTLTKRYHEALEADASNPSEESSKLVRERMSAAVSKIDKAVKRGVLHKNAGARRKSRLAKALKKQEGSDYSASRSAATAPASVEEAVAEETAATEETSTEETGTEVASTEVASTEDTSAEEVSAPTVAETNDEESE
ncbi:MAG: 30S ribosomal protein S20 [Cyanobacteria bacterium P01_D01_bin.1]